MNCIIIDDDKVSRLVIEKYISKTDLVSLTETFDNAVDAANYFNKNASSDLIFLDIEMPGMSGVEFLESLDNLPQIIIVSAKEKYALQAIQHDVTDYLLKPIVYSRFLKAVTKANTRHKEEAEKDNSKGIFVKSSSSSFVRLFYDDVMYIEAMENYVVITTYEHKHTIHFTMKALLNKLPADKFVRVHRSYIVNKDKVERIDDNMIIMNTKDKRKSIPISKSYKDDFMKKINIVNK
ncbi:MAG: LytTR family DNA-binding domain-containing protein [Bacteroidales bacterium]|nr:LytTR family DNA-binding domain-containing protein [Bacteroidales bacterium]